MKLYYSLLLGAIFLDAAVLPLVFGAGWMFKAVLAVLPFILLFAPERHIAPLAFITLVYLRASGSVNLGVLFLGLIVFLIYERWFLANFFHKTAWQSLILASAGLAVFYGVILGLSYLADRDGFYPGAVGFISLLFSVAASAGLNFWLSKIYRLE